MASSSRGGPLYVFDSLSVGRTMTPEAVKEREFVLPITGMTCANCAATVERALRKAEGVTEVSVNYATERATVHVASSMLGVDELAAAVERVGYGVVQADESNLDDAEAEVRRAELATQTRMFWTGVLFAGPLFALSMARDLSWLGAWAHATWVNWLMFALAVPVQFYVGWDYYVGSWKSLRNGSANMDVLVALGSSVAFAYSVLVDIRAQRRTRRLRRARLLRDCRAYHHAHHARQAARGPRKGRDRRGDTRAHESSTRDGTRRPGR